MSSTMDFRQLLLDLADDMSREEQKKFVFLLGDQIPRRARDDEFVEIFTLLIDRQQISETNCTYLQEIFNRLKLAKLAYKVARFEAGRISVQRKRPSNDSQYAMFAGRSLPPPVSRIPTWVQPSEPRRLGVPTWQDFDNELHEEDSFFPSPGTFVSVRNDQKNENDGFSMVTEQELVDVCSEMDNIDLKVFETEPWSDEFLQKLNIHIRPYEYQRELVQRAIQARNTIVCLRTGAGKTIIAGECRLSCETSVVETFVQLY